MNHPDAIASAPAVRTTTAMPTTKPAAPASTLDTDPLWYKSAIIYEAHIRAFHDSNGDGIGDFPGLTQKLDYLQDLGVTAIWLLPFYPSPLRDDGYDIADYTSINPSYGTLEDFKAFVKEAHARNIRVITELVLNHTSDQHPWFKRACKAPKGSPERDFYVWSDTDEKYRNVRIIFKDFEPSNWTFNRQAGQYYWHRFYHHQPDLNFDNPAVQDAMLGVMDQWFEMGVDGVRLDAVPYLFEREGTNCENLKEGHEFLRKLRAHVDAKFPGRMLLAEANMWPEDSVAYFGKGDECNMAFHFPVMPRLYMAMHQEDRFPIVDILQQTPAIPESCQWAVFLRNHDELTLEMVTDEERDYMYRAYAYDRRARINLGIRRRLAPLLGNNRRKIELMNALLFALPGTPVLYYGDEIGMGDNIYLGDRDAVRTPMQWSADRNAGFSKANPQKLFLPTIIDPEYHYETINVEAQQANPQSLLSWMKRLIALRQRHPVFGRGTVEFLHPDNPRVLAFIRDDGNERILVVANLSRFVQAVELDLRKDLGATPVELFGMTKFPAIGERPYFLTLGPSSFYWLELRPSTSAAGTITSSELGASLPRVAIRTGEWADALLGQSRSRVESAIASWMPGRRWFGAKSRTVRAVRVASTMRLNDAIDARVALIDVAYTEGEGEQYAVHLSAVPEADAGVLLRDHPWAAIAWIDAPSDTRFLLVDATSLPSFNAAIGGVLARGERVDAPLSVDSARDAGVGGGDMNPMPLGVEQSNTSVALGDSAIVKLFRKVQEGVNPDLEMSEFLTRRAKFPNTPEVLGSLHLSEPRKEPRTLAVLQRFVVNEGDAWSHALASVDQYFESVRHDNATLESPRDPSPLLASASPTPQDAIDRIGTYLTFAELLGRRTAEMHLALSSDRDDPAFAPEPFAAPHYQRALYQSMRTITRQSLEALRRSIAMVPDDSQKDALALLRAEDTILHAFRAIASEDFAGERIRTHGDYHLGQVLFTGRDFVIIDFEGEPARPIGERKLKRSPLRDMAGMIRSYHYAAFMGVARHMERFGDAAKAEAARYEAGARFWRHHVSASFLRSYLATLDGALLTGNRAHLAIMLRCFLLEKAIYELGYELNNRPSWVGIPVRGILALAEESPE